MTTSTPDYPRHTAAISGDWLMPDQTGQHVAYTEAYLGEIIDEWNGFAIFLATREVVDAIVARQAVTKSEFGPDAEAIIWDGDTLLVRSDDPEVDDQRIDSEADGRYKISFGWTWYEVEVSAVTGQIHGTTPVVADLSLVVACLARINDDIRQGVVPADVDSFSALHDHVDANMYLIDTLAEAEIDLGPDVEIALANAISDDIDAVLRGRAERRDREAHVLGTQAMLAGS